MVAAGPVHDYPIKFLPVRIHALLYFMRDQVERDIAFYLCRPPGHQEPSGFSGGIIG
jgi:hypothetical protein